MAAKTRKSRQELLQRLGKDLGQELSTHSIFLHELVARKLGVNATDSRCLDLIARAGANELTAGDLGRATGLTTGAVTGILDRLENAGLAERVRDAKDRRRVIARSRPEAAERVGKLYEALGAAMMNLASSYTTGELELIGDYLERNLAILKEQIAKLS